MLLYDPTLKLSIKLQASKKRKNWEKLKKIGKNWEKNRVNFAIFRQN
jgi:hypothetical protein